MRRFYPFALALTLAMTGIAQNAPAPPKPDPQATNQSPAVEEDPVTVKPNSTDQKKPVDTDPVMGVPPLPGGKTSMVGGTVSKIDGVHNRLSVKIFGDGHWDMSFDERTHFYRNGQETTFENVKKGDRVYVDTMLDRHQILARNVRVVTQSPPANARGQIMRFNNGVISVQDTLSRQPVQFRVDAQTGVKRSDRAASLSDLQPGALIDVRFAPEKENRGVAREIRILAAPGESFTFAGRVTHIDLRTGVIAVENRTDGRMYDVSCERGKIPSELMVGSDVNVTAGFDGKQYKASDIKVDKTATTAQAEETTTPSR